MHRLSSRLAIALVSLLLPALSIGQEATRKSDYSLDPKAYDLARILPAPPDEGSLAARADLEAVFQAQLTRTPAQIELAHSYAKYTVFHFNSVIGSWFTAENLPFAADFFKQIRSNRAAVGNAAKAIWNRKRPFQVDPTITPVLQAARQYSYPSGHATQAYVWSGMLAGIFPEHKTALRARARELAWTRVIAGVHFPSDIVGGEILGDFLAAEFLKKPEVRAALERVRAEAAPHLKSANTRPACPCEIPEPIKK